MAGQDVDILKDVDLITALHSDHDQVLSSALIEYLDKAYDYVEEGMGELSKDFQGYLTHFLEAISGARYLLLEMTQDHDE